MQDEETAAFRLRLRGESGRTPAQLRSKETEEKILTGARAILQNEGAQALSARKLAKECGLTTGAIYNLFSGMPDILFRLYEDQLRQEIETIERSFGQDDGSGSVKALLDRFIALDRALDWGNRFDLELMDAVNRNPDLQRLLETKNAILRTPIARSLKIRNPALDEEEADALGAYAVSLLQVAYRLRHRSDLGAKQLVYDVTLKLIESLFSSVPGGRP